MITMLINDNGTNSFHPKDINWSILSLGYVPLIQNITQITRAAFAMNHKADNVECAAPSRGISGHRQPPRNSSTVNAATVKVLIYSARKNTAQWAPLYSMKGPPINSDSAWWMSKGVRPSSASPATMNINNPRG